MAGGNGPSTPDGALGPSRAAPTILADLTLVRAGVGCSAPTLAGNVERQRIVGICETNRGTPRPQLIVRGRIRVLTVGGHGWVREHRGRDPVVDDQGIVVPRRGAVAAVVPEQVIDLDVARPAGSGGTDPATALDGP